MTKKLSPEEARARFYRVARTPKGRCPRCKTDISPGDRYYLTYSESIKQHPVHLSCKEAT